MTAAPQKPTEPKAPPVADWPRPTAKPGTAAQEAAGVLDDWRRSQPSERANPRGSDAALCLFPLLSRASRSTRSSRRRCATVTEENILEYLRYLRVARQFCDVGPKPLQDQRGSPRCLDPGRDWRWLQRVARRLDLRAKPRDKRNEVVPIKELFRLGLRLMDRGRKGRDVDRFREPCFIGMG